MAYNRQNRTGRHAGLSQRKSIRLKGYDYSQAGLYFITICCQDRAHLFGEIRRGEPMCSPDTAPDNTPNNNTPDTTVQMILNDAGKMITKWYDELENKFSDIRCHEMIVMPNHFHCIIENVGTTDAAPVGAEMRVCPNNINNPDKSDISDISGGHIGAGEHIGSPHRVVQWFKTMTTNEYIRGVKTLNWQPFNGKLWQRNYWEHIIRTENDFDRIAQYIINNPKNWNKDSLK